VPERGAGQSDFLSSRRSVASSGLAGLAALLGVHRVEAAPYLAPGQQQITNAGAATPVEPKPGPAAGPKIVNVRDFGARGDGSTDDAPAINAAIHEVREAHRRVDHFDLGCRILFPAGIYAVESSVNLTGLQNINTVIDGGASAILGRCRGKPVIDALGSRWLTVRDLTVLGDSVAVPDIGIQIGLLSTQIVADDHRFENLKVLGHFSRACLYNRAAETTGFDHVLLWNDHPGSHCLVQDGVNHFGVTSDFAASDVATDTALSFNENEFINCDFRHGAGGTPVWLGDTSRHAFIRCYTATEGGPSFVVYCGENSHLMLDVDCHCETDKPRDVFLFTGRSNRLAVRGFSYRDHRCFAANSVFSCDDHVAYVELQNAHIDIASFSNEGCKVFRQPDRWKVTGSFYSSDAGHWNGSGIFTGMVTVGSDVSFFGGLQASIRVPEVPRTDPPAAHQGALFRDRASNKLLIWTGTAWVDTLGQPL
jgi:Pectate lyase superfamily protein